jgi:hypothetical protein
MALSVGTYPILLADYQAALPFDIHLKPLTVGAERVLEEVLGEAMAEAATGIPPASDSASSVEPTVRHILAEVSADDPTVRYLRPHIERLRTGRPDAVTTRLYLESLLSLIPLRDGVLLTPAWPGAYPDHHAPSCFHILPFALSSQVSSAVEAGCRGRARYVRGDTTGSTDVIDGIWDSIAKASAVIADLTPAPARQGDSAVPSRLPNANVCLELAFAQVLGRRLLLVHDEREPFPELFPQIAKLQARPYRSTAQLTDMTASFVTQAVTRA